MGGYLWGGIRGRRVENVILTVNLASEVFLGQNGEARGSVGRGGREGVERGLGGAPGVCW